jgi:hypothetical protein
MTNNMLPLNCAHKIFFHHFKLNQFLELSLILPKRLETLGPYPFSAVLLMYSTTIKKYFWLCYFTLIYLPNKYTNL